MNQIEEATREVVNWEVLELNVSKLPIKIPIGHTFEIF